MVTESTGMGNLLMTTMMVRTIAMGMQPRVRYQPWMGPKVVWAVMVPDTPLMEPVPMVALVESWKRWQ